MDFMNEAFLEAKKAYDAGDHPIGAVLVIDGVILGKDRNKRRTEDDHFSHAETRLIKRFAQDIRKAHVENKSIELYTSLEPCIMCLGTAVMNKVQTIYFACPDPHAGATSIDKHITSWYADQWPKIKGPFHARGSYDLVMKYVRKHHPDKTDPTRREFESINKSNLD